MYVLLYSSKDILLINTIFLHIYHMHFPRMCVKLHGDWISNFEFRSAWNQVDLLLLQFGHFQYKNYRPNHHAISRTSGGNACGICVQKWYWLIKYLLSYKVKRTLSLHSNLGERRKATSSVTAACTTSPCYGAALRACIDGKTPANESSYQFTIMRIHVIQLPVQCEHLS